MAYHVRDCWQLNVLKSSLSRMQHGLGPVRGATLPEQETDGFHLLTEDNNNENRACSPGRCPE
jgi:hypothetical protein